MERVDNNYYLRIDLKRKRTNQEAVSRLIEALKKDQRVGKAFTGKIGAYSLGFCFHSAPARHTCVQMFHALLQPETYELHYDHNR